MVRFCSGKENAQVKISAPGFAGGLRNSPPFHQAEHFPRMQRFLQGDVFPEGNPPAKPGAEMLCSRSRNEKY